MPRKRITFIIIPANDGQVREFLLSRHALWGGVLLVVAVLAGLAYTTHGYLDRADQSRSLVQLEAENGGLLRSLEVTRRNVDKLASAMDVLALDDERLRAYHMMEPLVAEERMGGVGGSEEPPEVEAGLPEQKRALIEDLNSRIYRLQQEAGVQASSFAAIRQKFLERRGELRHFPTICPTPRARSWISSRFGYRSDPFTGRQAFHSGLDLAARTGTPVVATADGVVTQAFRDLRLGNVVVIDHDVLETSEDGHAFTRQGIYRTEYGHLDKILVSAGQRVQRGERIGLVGNTGRSTGPHLHYAVRFQDVRRGRHKGYVDPTEFLLDEMPQDARVANWWQGERSGAGSSHN
ncbi:MAG: M23 family metallopeptidase [Candidatus Latescibacterota bacterium]